MWSHPPTSLHLPDSSTIEISNFQQPSTTKVDVLHLCRALESSNASIYIDLSQTPVSNTGALAAADWQLWFSFFFFRANVEQWKKLVGFFSELFEVDWSNTNGCTHEQKYGCTIKYVYGYIYMAYVSRVFLRGAMRIQHLRCLKGSPSSNHGKQWGRDARNDANPEGHRMFSLAIMWNTTAMFFQRKNYQRFVV